MRHFNDRLRAGRSRAKWAVGATGLLTLGLLAALAFGGVAGAAATAVPLGAADSFSVLAGAGVTNTGPTTLGGDIGSYATTSITGTSTLTVLGVNHGGDAVTQQAKTDLLNASTVAAGQGPTSPIVADLGGQTLVPGVYNSASSIGLTGTVTLDAGGDPNAVFVFQAGSTLTTASTSNVKLINGANPCNVFWQVGSSATLGTGSTFRGTILAADSITVTTGVTLIGRALASTGAVTLDTDTIGTAGCVASPGATTGTTTTAPVTTTAPTPPPPASTTAPTPTPPAATTTAAATTSAAPVTTTAATTTSPTPTTTSSSTTTTKTPSGPTSKQIAAAKATKRAAAVKAKRIAVAKAKAKRAAGSTSTKVTRTAPKPARHHAGFTG